jgi:hypothetical protein
MTCTLTAGEISRKTSRVLSMYSVPVRLFIMRYSPAAAATG